MADINKITKTKLKATEENTSPTVNLEPGEIKAITKSRLMSNVSGGGSGGESVSPTLNLMDLGEGTVRTTITEQEKLNLEKGLYNQVNYFRSNQDLDGLSIYMPSKLFSTYGAYLFCVMIAVDANNPVVNNLEFYMLQIGEKNADGEYPITIQSGKDTGLPNLPFGTGGGSSDTAIITLSDSQAIEISNAKITFTEEQFNIIKKQGFIKLNYNNNTIISGIVTYYNNNKGYSLEGLFYNPLIGNSSVLIYIPNEYNYTELNVDVKQFVNKVDFAINTNNFSIQYNEDYSVNKIYLDKINNTSIIHTTEEDVNNYTIPTITFED